MNTYIDALLSSGQTSLYISKKSMVAVLFNSYICLLFSVLRLELWLEKECLKFTALNFIKI